ncbi:phosphoglucomutase/phosphomannomutase family protein [Iningainema sp. BLCCT55]|uniref:Phosphoglucomutase/phosphomannomutase family protein n=1 Tax=Iningainema tapete BLCC-T55 TaxID=2748662 RepID=A0A8J6XJG2_9CYAN|nr:phosphoglucomutase/phosphomannomutase family protein [Iningainema tapete BLCC-T55]
MSNSSDFSKIKFCIDGWRGIFADDFTFGWRGIFADDFTFGWRGIFADDFTFAFADDFTFSNLRKVTWAIARYLETAYSKDRPILIAYDTRFIADQLACTAAVALSGLGWMVKISKQNCPTPVIAYNARYLNSAGALMFTASHHPTLYCGIKYIPDYGGPATKEITDTIVAHIKGVTDIPPTEDLTGKFSCFDPKPEYLRFLYSQLDIERIRHAQLKVKYDALDSTSFSYLNTVLEHCGCQTQTQTTRNILGVRMPRSFGEQMTILGEVVKQQADLGLMTDREGNRCGIVDEQGNILSSNTVLILLTRHLIKNKRKKGAIVRTVATTHLLDNLAAQYGLEIYETPVGFKYIGEKMRQTDVLIGGEESGGLSILGHIPEKDGFLANLLVAEAIAYEGKPLSQIVEEATKEASSQVYNHC